MSVLLSRVAAIIRLLDTRMSVPYVPLKTLVPAEIFLADISFFDRGQILNMVKAEKYAKEHKD